ncbi:2OG-Fe(II) oxygenase [Chitinimonas sp.]|uniref:2OG-Fe(II) oxygenase n=1 Tax=Chitinimonas sp. TaxID=1934313 RepID=UPI002F93E20B
MAQDLFDLAVEPPAAPAPLAPHGGLGERLATVNGAWLGQELDRHGCAVLPALLTAAECAALAALYAEPAHFRSRVVMARHGFGSGEYQYFAYPLPTPVAELRHAAYQLLRPTAQRWAAALGEDKHYPPDYADYLARCQAAGQLRPTSLLLQYGAGDYNCLHQDLYGEEVFPLQLAVLLSAPGKDFSGGEFVLTEQRPRMQSRVEVVPLQQGDAVCFAVQARPQQGARGAYRVQLRHGVSRVRSGRRHVLGVILHDAT